MLPFEIKWREGNTKMEAELFPSSFLCNCGEELNFFENTIRDMKRMSTNKRVRLGEGKHTIVFYRNEAIEILCPRLGSCAITDSD